MHEERRACMKEAPRRRITVTSSSNVISMDQLGIIVLVKYQSFCTFVRIGSTTTSAALIKKKRKFSSFIRKIRWHRLQSHTREKCFLIYEEMRKL